MRKLLIIPVAALCALPLAGCEAFNGGLAHESSKIAKPILRFADSTCAQRGGTANIMLMTDREDDGIVTCKDGTNHYFDV